MTGISAGKTWSRIGPEVAPTSSSASGVWLLNEVAENEGAGTWPEPPAGVFECIAKQTVSGASTTSVEFTSIPSSTYDNIEVIIAWVPATSNSASGIENTEVKNGIPILFENSNNSMCFSRVNSASL